MHYIFGLPHLSESIYLKDICLRIYTIWQTNSCVDFLLEWTITGVRNRYFCKTCNQPLYLYNFFCIAYPRKCQLVSIIFDFCFCKLILQKSHKWSFFTMSSKIVEKKLHVDSYLYAWSQASNNKTLWYCRSEKWLIHSKAWVIATLLSTTGVLKEHQDRWLNYRDKIQTVNECNTYKNDNIIIEFKNYCLFFKFARNF